MKLEPIWTPSKERIAAARITDFTAWLKKRAIVSAESYQALWQWSVEKPTEFWPALWDYTGVIASKRWQTVMDKSSMPTLTDRGTRWFEGARLNFAENLLRNRSAKLACIFWSENGQKRSLSYAQLATLVSKLQQFLQTQGIRPGDRVGGFVANTPEAVAAMLAAASLGAIWSSTSPDFGFQAVHDRFSQIEPKVLFVTDRYFYSGKEFSCEEKAAQLRKALPSLKAMVVMPYDGTATTWEGEFTLPKIQQIYPEKPLFFEQLPFDHPLYILYSSGTTGIPKCIVHGTGGTLLQHLKELMLHTDLKAEDRIFYYTTCGWMMWNWIVSSLALEATICLYEGNPFHPRPATLFRMIDEVGISIFGTSARFLISVEKVGLKPREDFTLKTLRTILSTGSPLPPSSFEYVYRDIKADLCLSSISGGTDIVSCFIGGNPTLPVYPGVGQVRELGTHVAVLDAEAATPTPLPPNAAGELVCLNPFPCMPVCYWNDPDNKKYFEAYFATFPGVWRHGDWVELTPEGGMIIYGRSDAVLKPGGVRIGTAELYRQVETIPEIQESLVVGQQWQNDERIVLFVKLREGIVLTEALINTIKKTIRANTSPRHVPAKIIAVPDIPKTVNGKIVELAVKNIIHGRPVKNKDALSNPDCLKFFENRPELAV
jgi:acetoacetyl-CoA synthetase